MQIDDKISIIEAVLFACGEPVESEKLCEAAGIEAASLHKLISLLNDRYDSAGSALKALRLGTGYQLSTRAEFSEYIKAALENKRTAVLSPAAMEVLTIVAYNQPVTKSFVEHIRGIDSSSVVNSLVEKELLEEAGRLDIPGKPIAYRTTSGFLRCFQLSSLAQLPVISGKNEQVSFDETLKV